MFIFIFINYFELQRKLKNCLLKRVDFKNKKSKILMDL